MQTRTRIRLAGIVTALFVAGLSVLGLVARDDGPVQDPPATPAEASALLQFAVEGDDAYAEDDESDEESEDEESDDDD